MSFEPVEVSSKTVIDDPDNPGDDNGPVDPNPNPSPDPLGMEQVFQQKASSGKLDLLVVIDNSDSMMMDHAHHKIRNMFNGFLSTLEGVDYQIGFTTTNHYNRHQFNVSGWGGTLEGLRGEDLKILSPNTPNKEALFLNALDREEAVKCRKGQRDEVKACGTNYEQPLRVIKQFVDKRDKENTGFFREESDFVTIIITDENETTEGGFAVTKPDSVISHVEQNFSGLKNYTNYSVIIEPGDRVCRREQACSEFPCWWLGSEYGYEASELSKKTSGRTTSICSQDVSSDFKVIGESVKQGGLFSEVKLQFEPLDGSVSVKMVPDSGVTYSIDGKIIKFSEAPANGTEITVNYRYNE